MSTRRKAKTKAPESRRCKYCKQSFEPHRAKPNQVFCSPQHRRDYWNNSKTPFPEVLHRIENRLGEKIEKSLGTFRVKWRLANADEIPAIGEKLEVLSIIPDTVAQVCREVDVLTLRTAELESKTDLLERARREVEILTLRLAELEKKFDLLDLTVSRLG